MGGAAGHMMHLYDNRDLTFRELKDILTLASSGNLETTEKIDGFNVALSFRDGHAVAARNRTDIEKGGLTIRDLLERDFAGGDEVKKVYINALKSFEKGVKTLDENLINKLFENGTIFYNAELLGPSAKNVINYDKNVIVIHKTGHVKYSPKTDKIIPINIEKYSKFLDKVINQMEEATADQPFQVRNSAVQKLKKIDSKEDLNIALSRIEKLMSSVGLSNKNTIEDYILLYLDKYVHESMPEICQPETGLCRLVIDNIMGFEKMTGQKIPKELRHKISIIRKNSEEIIDKAIFPLEEIITDFAAELLRGVKSAYIVDDRKEADRLQKEVDAAIRAIKKSNNEEAINILIKQLKKIKHHDKIATAVEGIVFTYKDKVYKLTGVFAPINQILGLFKYGRGKRIPPIQKEEVINEAQNKTVAIIPGGFKPPHAGHYELVKYFADMPNIDEVIVLISPKERAGHSKDKRIVITSDMSLKLWQLYTQSDPKIIIGISKDSSPVKASYDYMETLNKGDTVVLGQSEKEKKEKSGRFDNAKKWAKDQHLGLNVKIVTTPLFSRGISGTDIRNFIVNKDKNKFFDYLPKHLTPNEKEKAWKIVASGMNEETIFESGVYKMVEKYLNEVIRKTPNKNEWCVYSKKSNKNLGCYDSQAGAKKRIKQVEYFKSLEEEIKDYQDKVKRGHKKMKKRIIATGKQNASAGGGPFKNKPDYERSKSAPPSFGGLEEVEKIKGGKSSGMVESDFDPEQLKKGIKVEMEHTDDPDIAKEIAADHLAEDEKYYDKLEKIHVDEVSAMGAGNVAGFSGEEEDKKKKVVKEFTINRETFLQELKLREYIRKMFKVYENNKRQKIHQKIQEYKMRKYVQSLLKEVEVEDDVPHRSTGINILEDLLKKIVPILEDDYKLLTTNNEQRESFRAHIIHGVQNTLAPGIAVDKAGTKAEETSKMIPVEEEDIKVKIDGEEKKEDKDAVESDIEKDIDISNADKAFIDIEKDKKDDELSGFELTGEDETGRNMALKTFEKIEKNVLDAFSLLSDEEDKQLFYDYLLTNLKLYFDKFETELKPHLEEPTTPEYEEEKDKQEAEGEEGEAAEEEGDLEGLGDEEELSLEDLKEVANSVLEENK